MQGTVGKRAAGADRSALRRYVRLCALLLLPLAAGACASDGPPGSLAAAPRTGATIAFELIDGPPLAAFNKLVASLSTEAGSRQIAVVSREASPYYRIRGYLAVHVVDNRAHVGWVWDIYDVDRRRAYRIAGEEAGSRPGREAWATADEAMLRRIARASMDQIVGFLSAPPPAGEPPQDPPSRGPAIALAGPPQ